jgi:hypothetical protein
MAIQNTAVGISPTAIFTSYGEEVTTTIYLCNFTTSTVSVNMHLVPLGSIAGNDNIIYKNITLVAEETYIMDMEKLLFNNGDTIFVSASQASAVTATVSSYTL